MNSNFNRQFIGIDFKLLENKDFLKFIGSSEFATYLILRRNVWRSKQEHYMNLHKYYEEGKLVSSIERDDISKLTGIALNNISHHLSSLEKKGILKRIRTGKQNIYVLGEWVDVFGNGTYREVEWFFMEGKFGISKSDLMESVKSDVTKTLGQTHPKALDQTYSKALGNNNKDNREINTVNNGEINFLKRMTNLGEPEGKTDTLVQDIINQLGDEHSRKFYKLVSAKIPEGVIRVALAEIKADGAQYPPRVFTKRMMDYALKQAGRGIGKSFNNPSLTPH